MPWAERKSKTTAIQHDPESKIGAFLANPKVRKWYDNLARGTVVTAERPAWHLFYACKRMNLNNPDELLALGKTEIQDRLEAIVDRMEGEDYAPKYIGVSVQCVKSFAENNDIEITRRMKIRNSVNPVSLKDERVPKPTELD